MRQSAFALLGDLAKTFSEHLRPVLLQFAGLAVANLEGNMITQHSMPACNNACWSLGELPCLPGSVFSTYMSWSASSSCLSVRGELQVV